MSFLTRRVHCSRDDTGAVAVLVAILAIALFAAGAVTVDLGNAYSRARSQQARADLAALSAGNLLPADDAATKSAVAQKIADYLNNPDNSIQDDAATGTPHTFTGSELISSGAVTFPTASGDRVVFKAPDVRVDFSLARALGAANMTVSRQATVGVFSISENVVAPLYAVQGCDYGSQVLKDSPNGQSAPTTIPSMDLTGGSDSNNQISMSTVTPSSVAADASPAPTLALTGDFKGNGSGPSLIDAVGFFWDNMGPSPYTVQPVTPTAVTATSANVVVPSTVLSTAGFWYVCVRESGKWSDPVSTAILTVGDVGPPPAPHPRRRQLRDARVRGPEQPQHRHRPDLQDRAREDHRRVPGLAGTHLLQRTAAPGPIYDSTVDDANCVYTAGGFKPNAATAGLLSDSDARLNKDTTPACGSSRTTVGGYSINNDTLSCFLTNTTTTLADIESSSYAGPPVLSPDIIKSPRFFFVPVFGTEPATGTSKAYPIIEFRPAFLTDQPVTATQGTAPNPGNGITMCCSNKVQSLNFTLFSPKALPDYLDSGLPTSPTYVFGPKVIKLID